VNEPTHLDLYSGLGGFSLAFEAAGFRTVGFSEVDPFASSVIASHWPNVPNYGLDTDVPGRSLRGLVDVVTAGFPCQPFSEAGFKRGKDDPRYRWPATLQILRDVGPGFFLGENVPGIVGMVLADILTDLENEGFQPQVFSIPACAVGADHERERIWILAAHAERSRLQRRERKDKLREPAGPAFAIPRYQMSGGWNRWVEYLRGLPPSNGIPLRVARKAVKAYGNSIIPQIAHVFAKTIYDQNYRQAQGPETDQPILAEK
jgi:DNA (cytosine-5)-methyltransferase 1